MSALQMLLKLVLGLKLAAAVRLGTVLGHFGHIVYKLVQQVPQTLNLLQLLIGRHVLRIRHSQTKLMATYHN